MSNSPVLRERVRTSTPIARVTRSDAVCASLSLMVLEPRMLFDGAVAATADVITDASQPGINGLVPAGEAPAELVARWADLPPNLPPVANPDERVITADSGPVQGNVVAGNDQGDVADYDPEGDAFFVVGVVPGRTTDVPQGPTGRAIEGQYGTLTMNNDGSYVYVPNQAFADAAASGAAVQDTFSYLVCDDAGNLATTTLTIRTEAPVPGGPGGVPGGPGSDPTDPAQPPTTGGPTDPTDPAQPPTAGGPTDPTDPAQPPTAGPTDPGTDPGDPGGPIGGGSQPPVAVAPGDPSPPVTPDPGPNGSVSPIRDGYDPNDTAGLVAPYSLLSPERLKQLSLPIDSSLDVFSPFAPMAVLGMVETPAGRDAALAVKAAAAVAADEDCVPAPKPKAVKRASVLSDGVVVKPRVEAYSEKSGPVKPRSVPVKPKVVAGRQC